MKLWDIARDMWDHRNQWVHNTEMGTLVKQLHQDISREYNMGGSTLPLPEQVLFRRTLESLLASSTATKQLWLQRIRTARQQQQVIQREGTVEYTRERNFMRAWIQKANT